MEEVAKRAAQRALNQLRMSRRTLRAGAGQVKVGSYFCIKLVGLLLRHINQNDPSLVIIPRVEVAKTLIGFPFNCHRHFVGRLPVVMDR